MMPWFLGNSFNYNVHWMWWGIAPMMVWSLFWKGLALWHAAKRSQPWWFIALLVVNTVGILEICYLAFEIKLFSSSYTPPKKRQKRDK
ncbi:MAG: hypothetical protein ACD_48C00103G0007 [uncultured bacterium]|nr:MAG: hypothetical protein ACD_48C00103G0007 [uncultured bacterium]